MNLDMLMNEEASTPTGWRFGISGVKKDRWRARGLAQFLWRARILEISLLLEPLLPLHVSCSYV